MIPFTAILALLAVFIATVEFNRAQRAKASLASVLQDEVGLRAKLRDLQQRLAEEESTVQPPAEPAEVATPGPPLPPSRPYPTLVAEGRELMARHPEIRQLLIADQKARSAVRYAPLFAALGLTPGQIDEVGDLLLQGRPLTQHIPLRVNQITLNAERVPPLPAGEVAERARALLGDRGLERLRDYDRDDFGHQSVAEVASAVCRTAPLNREQVHQMTRIFAEANAALRARGAVARDSVYWRTVMEQGHPLLSPPQFEALTWLQAREAAQTAWAEINRAAEAADRAAAEAKAGPP